MPVDAPHHKVVLVRSSFSSPAVVLVVAVATGVLGPLFDAEGGRVSQSVSATLVSGWMYAAVSFLAGTVSGSRRGAAAFGVVSLWVCVCAYYLTKAAQGDYLKADLSDPSANTEHFAWGEFVSMIGVWCVFACLLGPVCGFAGWLSRNGPQRVVSRLLIPCVVVVETTMRLSHPAPLQDQSVVTTWQATRVVAVAVALVVTVGTWWTSRRRGAARQAGDASPDRAQL
ncbi:DUF6518 family protein [Streptomyces sp. NPDC054784]